MDDETLWNITELNKFIFQRTRAMCEAVGFVESPRQAKHLVRVRDRHIQIVHPEIYRSRVLLRFGVSSVASFRRIILGEARIYLRKDDKKDEFFNDFYMLAVDPYSAKLVFDSGKMQSVWNEIVTPQLEEELFSVLRPLDFARFMELCENRKHGILRYSSEPGIDDATLAFSRALGRIWQGKAAESIPLLEHALSGYEKHFTRCETFGEPVIPEIQEEQAAVRELLSAVKNGTGILEHLEKLEKTALNKTWGVALSPEGATVRLKKKEWV